MMRTTKFYEQPELFVLTFEEDVVTTSGLPTQEEVLFDKGVEDFFGN